MGFGSTLKGILKTVAPTIATAVGGPMGGIAMKFLADKFVGGDTGKVEEFLIGANPEQLKELKFADMEFKKEMARLGVDLEEIAAGDRASARDLAKTKGILPQITISLAYSAGYFGVLAAFITGHLDVQEAHQSMFNGLLGVLSAAQIQIMNFWFGSSAGSKAKTTALANGKAG
jgi:hypothetical protein